MKITIAGTGNAGTTIAADLVQKGHSVTILKTSDKIYNEHFECLKKTKTIHMKDGEKEISSVLTDVTKDVKKAISEAEVIIIFLQTNYHEDFIKRISPYIKNGQTFIIEPGYLSTCYFLKNSNKDITIIEAESSPIDCRITAPGRVKVLFKNIRNPFGIYPSKNKEQGIKVLNALGFPYVLTNGIIEAALHNPNLIVHTVGAIFSIPRIEYSKGQYSMYKEVFTPHVWNVVESLDNEKMNILESVGCERIPYVEACKFRNSFDDTANALDVFFDYANNSSPSGPDIPDSRYVTEDVPQGLVLLESLGAFLGVPTPVCSGLIDIASAAIKRDFRFEGRKIERLGLDNIKQVLSEEQNR